MSNFIINLFKKKKYKSAYLSIENGQIYYDPQLIEISNGIARQKEQK